MSISTTKQSQSRDFQQRILNCLTKLADRDTHTAAAHELESIAKSLSISALPSFLSSISSTTNSADKSPVRRQCLRLISIVSEHHGNSISPHVSKLISAVNRRLRDHDSSTRAACVAAAFSLASHVTSPNPFASIAKPLLESLFTEQDTNSQNGAALCLAAVVDGSTNPDAGGLRRMLPRLEKLAKCKRFKAKAAVLALIASVVGVKGVLCGGRSNEVRNLVVCLVELLSDDDWGVRKAAAEALIKIAVVVEKHALSEYKAYCLKTFEAKRFDKVKAAREKMSQMIEVWKEIPDLPDENSPPCKSQETSRENDSDGRCPPGPRTSIGSNSPQIKKKSPLANPSSSTPFPDGSPASTARKRSPLGGYENKRGTAMFRKLDHKKPSDWKVESAAAPTGLVVSEDDHLDGDGRGLKAREEEIGFAKPEIKRALFDESYENPKLGVFRNGSRVVPCGEASVVVSNETGDICRNPRESEDLSHIRKQLVQIENQQSNLLDLLQRFIGGSQNGIHSLEARVHGLELALDEISFDLAVSNGRFPQNDAAGAMCCKLPGTDFLSSKLWRKTEGRSSTSRLPTSCGTSSNAAVCSVPNKNRDAEVFPLENHRYQFQGGRGLIMNPLAGIPRGSQGLSETSSAGIFNNVAV